MPAGRGFCCRPLERLPATAPLNLTSIACSIFAICCSDAVDYTIPIVSLASSQTALRSAHKGPMASWLQVAAPLLELYAALAAQCRMTAAGAQLLSLLASGQAAAGLLAPIARLAAAKADAAKYSSDETAAVTAALHFAAAAAALIARQPIATEVHSAMLLAAAISK